jgi:hypothetical protein
MEPPMLITPAVTAVAGSVSDTALALARVNVVAVEAVQRRSTPLLALVRKPVTVNDAPAKALFAPPVMVPV